MDGDVQYASTSADTFETVRDRSLA